MFIYICRPIINIYIYIYIYIYIFVCVCVYVCVCVCVCVCVYDRPFPQTPGMLITKENKTKNYSLFTWQTSESYTGFHANPQGVVTI